MSVSLLSYMNSVPAYVITGISKEQILGSSEEYLLPRCDTKFEVHVSFSLLVLMWRSKMKLPDQ